MSMYTTMPAPAVNMNAKRPFIVVAVTRLPLILSYLDPFDAVRVERVASATHVLVSPILLEQKAESFFARCLPNHYKFHKLIRVSPRPVNFWRSRLWNDKAARRGPVNQLKRPCPGKECQKKPKRLRPSTTWLHLLWCKPSCNVCCEAEAWTTYKLISAKNAKRVYLLTKKQLDAIPSLLVSPPGSIGTKAKPVEVFLEMAVRAAALSASELAAAVAKKNAKAAATYATSLAAWEEEKRAYDELLVVYRKSGRTHKERDAEKPKKPKEKPRRSWFGHERRGVPMVSARCVIVDFDPAKVTCLVGDSIGDADPRHNGGAAVKSTSAPVARATRSHTAPEALMAQADHRVVFVGQSAQTVPVKDAQTKAKEGTKRRFKAYTDKHGKTRAPAAAAAKKEKKSPTLARGARAGSKGGSAKRRSGVAPQPCKRERGESASSEREMRLRQRVAKAEDSSPRLV